MSNSESFVEVATVQSFRVQEFAGEQPFQGIYLGTRVGQHGRNYLFFSDGHYVQIFGIKALHQKMALVKPGCEVRITYLQEVQLKDGNRFHDIKVEHSKNEIENFDLCAHLNSCGETLD